MRKKLLRKIGWSFLVLAIVGAALWAAELRPELMETAGVRPPEISAKQAALMDAKTGEILYEKNIDEKAYPASITKIMTALVTLEVMEQLKSDLDQKVKIPEEAPGTEGSSIYLSAGEAVSIKDLLYGLMLRSGNDAAVALAEIIGGNTDNFVKLMNERAKGLGCTGTNFLNPSGLYDENHYTSARDMALIAREAMSHEEFCRIVAAKTWQAARASDKYCYFYNKNKVVHQYEGGTGIKIGFTKASGRTLVASASRDGRELICVVMNASDWFNDAYALMDYGFGL